MNILICSVGRRVKLVHYFKEALHKVNGRVIAVDCDINAPALHCADVFEVVPRIDHPNYITHIIDLCVKYEAKGVLTLIDPELSLLASYKKELANHGIQAIVSEERIIDICFDKYNTYQFLQENNIPCIPTYIDVEKAMKDIDIGKISFPLIVKPRNGSASIGIHKVTTMKEVEDYKERSHFVLQPFIDGDEYGVDCYIDLITQQTTNIFVKKKISMRAGETDKSISIIDPILNEEVEKLINVLKPIGPIDIDCFKTENGYVISEINPRFGGGYPHAHELGQNFVHNIINNLFEKANSFDEKGYKEGSTLLKFDDFILF
ncbi:carbamoyl-phosphate synthase large subunit [Cytobacillus eiseniae]|uniref:Carbamoyl-phosphate synthase large subunit n=1 Tax=Cytobacillus eiseniae TaxID=762947 RepID=A0ABS4RHF3_9BACI|nr:ATP-grasp domain-containing protein [Cytobacillus eiseniae]MBP2241856.1 carbamoyl-phosphate synthase large subunit [Cytobacillus eiseniae]